MSGSGHSPPKQANLNYFYLFPGGIADIAALRILPTSFESKPDISLGQRRRRTLQVIELTELSGLVKSSSGKT
jgi:hypothetical protein